MSYDITFIQKSEAQTWQEALEANEARVSALESWNSPASDAAYAEWQRISALLLECNPGMSKHVAPHCLELTDDATGLQVSLFESEAGISIPYAHSNETAQPIMELVKRFALIIEEETGLVGYDGQLDRRYLDSPTTAQEAGAFLGSTSHRLHEGDLLQRSNKKKRKPWWMFWRN